MWSSPIPPLNIHSPQPLRFHNALRFWGQSAGRYGVMSMGSSTKTVLVPPPISS